MNHRRRCAIFEFRSVAPVLNPRKLVKARRILSAPDAARLGLQLTTTGDCIPSDKKCGLTEFGMGGESGSGLAEASTEPMANFESTIEIWRQDPGKVAYQPLAVSDHGPGPSILIRDAAGSIPVFRLPGN